MSKYYLIEDQELTDQARVLFDGVKQVFTLEKETDDPKAISIEHFSLDDPQHITPTTLPVVINFESGKFTLMAQAEWAWTFLISD